MIRGLIAAVILVWFASVANAGCMAAAYDENPCAIRPPPVEYERPAMHHYRHQHAVYKPHPAAYHRPAAVEPPLSPYLHRWIPNAEIVGICPTEPDYHWAVSPVVGGINRIPKVAGDRVGMKVFIDASDGKVYRRPRSGYFYFDRDRDKILAGS